MINVLGLPPLKELEKRLQEKINELTDQKKKVIEEKHKENIEYLTKRLDNIAKEFAKRIST